MSEGFRYKQYERLERISDSDVPSTASTKSEETGQRLIDIAWSAGLLDGEGCFTAASSGSPVIAVDSTSRVTIEHMHRICGGSCSCLTRKTSRNYFVYRWRVSGQNAIRVATMVAPYLREKAEQARILIHLTSYPPSSAMRASLKSRLRALKKADT